MSPGVKALAPAIYATLLGAGGVTRPPDPIQGKPTLAAAQAAFEALPPVRILFDNGAGRSPGQPYPGFERSFPRWPVPGRHAASWYLAASGTLTASKPTGSGSDRFTWNTRA